MTSFSKVDNLKVEVCSVNDRCSTTISDIMAKCYVLFSNGNTSIRARIQFLQFTSCLQRRSVFHTISVTVYQEEQV